jgi:hypothetical protein
LTDSIPGGERWFHDLLKALPAAVHVTDGRGAITFYNAAAADLWERQPMPGTPLAPGFWQLCRPDGTPLPCDMWPPSQ